MFVRTYYQVKPLLPSRLRLAARRWRAERRRARFAAEWPIDPKAAAKPAGWSGWPDGKKFALVLTHDVEGRRGLEQCLALAAIEKGRGLRSAFNFVPEGEYRVPASVREQLSQDGFEVGVHDLHHDGKLYWSRAAFRRHAEKINRYIREWNATGFRSGFMHHNLEWLHDLDVAYDSSTFDTDPFEPQPDGMGTIFPFWVPAPRPTSALDSPAIPNPQSSILNPQSAGDDVSKSSTAPSCPPSSTLDSPAIRNPQSTIRNPQSAGDDVSHSTTDLRSPTSDLRPLPSSALRPPRGYIELPYTLPQDFSLFLLLQERTIDIWKQKLDWIAEQGGMAMLDVHPDYIDLSGPGQPGISFPVAFYAEFLDYVRTKYAGQFWLALPREAAQHAKKCLVPDVNGPLPLSTKRNGKRRKIWIDLDNTPHVPLFEPIIEELKRRDFDVVLTARDAFQVCDLADQKGLRYTKVGRHHGKNKIAKVVGLFYRALQLMPFVLREKPDLALSHGARSQIIICNLLHIPTVLMADYEFAQYPPFMKPEWEMVPEVIPNEALCCAANRIRKYPGIKEDIYVNRMQIDPGFTQRLGILPGELVITVRPPATEAHYHNPESEQLFVRFMDRACQEKSVRVVLLPRNGRQGDMIRLNWPQWFENSRTIIPTTAVDGLNLLWYSDLVVSGGGTMNREAAALGVPVYSIFRGKTGAIDRHLQEEGRLVMIESVEEVDRKIIVERRHRNGHVNGTPRRALSVVADHIADIALRSDL